MGKSTLKVNFSENVISDLLNVDAPSPTDGQALIWNAAESVWKPGSVAAGGATSQLDADGTTLDINAIADNTLVMRTGTDVVGTKVAPVGAVVGTTDTQTLTNKFISLGSRLGSGITWSTQNASIASGGSNAEISWLIEYTKLTLSANGTVSFSQIPGANLGYSTIRVLQANGGGHNITSWPASVQWATGSAPDFSSMADGESAIVYLSSEDGGTTVQGWTTLDLGASSTSASQLDANGTILDVNAITDTTFLQRSGNAVVGSKVVPTGAVVGTTDVQTLSNKTLANGVIRNESLWNSEVVALSGGTVDISYTNYSNKILNITANTTLTFSAFPNPGFFSYAFFEIVQDATGGREITWPASVRWTSGEAPDLINAEPNEVIFVSFWTRDGGLTVYGSHNKPPLIRYSVATDETLLLTDLEKTVRCSNSAAITFTIPAGLDDWPNGGVAAIRQGASGTVTFVAASGVLLRSKGGLTSMDGQFASAALQKEGTDVWWLGGDLV